MHIGSLQVRRPNSTFTTLPRPREPWSSTGSGSDAGVGSRSSSCTALGCGSGSAVYPGQHLDPTGKLVRALVQDVVLVSRSDGVLPAKNDIGSDIDHEHSSPSGDHVHAAHHTFDETLALARRVIVNADPVS